MNDSQNNSKTNQPRAPLQLPSQPQAVEQQQQQRAALTAQKQALAMKGGRARSSTLLGSKQKRQYLSVVAPSQSGSSLRQNFLDTFSMEPETAQKFEKTKANANSNIKATLENLKASERDFSSRVQARQRVVSQRISQTTRATQILLRNNYSQVQPQNLLPKVFQNLKNALFQNKDRLFSMRTPSRRVNATFASLFLLSSASLYTQLHKFRQQQDSESSSFMSHMASAVQTSAMKNVLSILDSVPVSTEWQGWLNRAFQATQTHNALLYLLVNGIQDQKFVDHSIVYGLDLLDVGFRSKQVLDSSLQMVNECLVQEQRVVNEAVNLCKWIATHETVRDLSSELMCRVHFREDVCQVMTWQTACAGYDACMTDEVRQVAFDEGFKAVATDKFVDGAYSSAVNKTLANMVTLGLYGYFTNPEEVQIGTNSKEEEVAKQQ